MALLARRRLEPDVLLHRRTASTGRRPASSSYFGHAQRPVHEVRQPTASARSTASSPTATRRTGRTACTTCATRTSALLRGGRAQARDARGRAAAHLQARPHLQLLRRRRARLGPRHRARPPTAARASSTRAASTTATPSGTPTTTARKWLSRKIVEAGAGRPSFHSGGATLDHEDPRDRLPVAHDRHWNQVEQWFTPDSGRTWTHRQLTSDPTGYAIRPVTPRGLGQAANRILYVWGDERTIGFTDYTTRVHALDF